MRYPFNLLHLVSITSLCKSGDIPLSIRTVRELCRRGKFPSIKQGGEYLTTPEAVRQYFYSKSNASFRRISA